MPNMQKKSSRHGGDIFQIGKIVYNVYRACSLSCLSVEPSWLKYYGL